MAIRMMLESAIELRNAINKARIPDHAWGAKVVIELNGRDQIDAAVQICSPTGDLYIITSMDEYHEVIDTWNVDVSDIFGPPWSHQ